MKEGARLLVIGLDGADWKIIDRLRTEKKIPNIEKLIQNGFSAPLNSTMPPMTLPSWSSMLTGANPGKHGIFDFLHKEDNRWKLRFSSAKDRQIPTLHEVLSAQGKRVASIAVPTTWPPSQVNGVMISGFDSPVSTGIDGSFCYPSTLYKEIEERFGGLCFADFQESLIGEGWHERALALLQKEIRRKTEITKWLLSQERWECLMLLFGESDTVSHHFWAFFDPDSPRAPKEIPAHLQTAIMDIYIALDRAVGELVAMANAEIVCICSDHGFGGAGDIALYLNRFLEEKGWLIYKNQQKVDGLRFGTGLSDRVREKALKTIPSRWQGKIFRLVPNRILNRLETNSRFGNIDFSRTKAISDEMNYAATIRLNIDKNEQRTVVSALKKDLLDWEVAGEKPIRNVWYREELYDGDCVERSPEIILELNLRENYSYTLLPSSRVEKGITWRKLTDSEKLGGKGFGMNGSHRQQGVLVISGEKLKKQHSINSDDEIPNMKDIMPTLLTLIEAKVPYHCDGIVLQYIFRQEMEEKRYFWNGENKDKQADISKEEKEAIRKRLEGLGYL